MEFDQIRPKGTTTAQVLAIPPIIEGRRPKNLKPVLFFINYKSNRKLQSHHYVVNNSVK